MSEVPTSSGQPGKKPVRVLAPKNDDKTIHKMTIPGTNQEIELHVDNLRLDCSAPATQVAGSTPWQRIIAIQDEMRAALIGREQEIRIGLLALLCRQHAFLSGPPGTAKSLTFESLCKFIQGAVFFTQLMSRSITIDDLMGPLDIEEIHRGGGFRTDVRGRMPQAHICFLDELWNANGSILNSLLKILNERAYFNSGVWHPSPLHSVFGASNHLPDTTERSELLAVYDRFLFRATVKPLKQQDQIQRLYFPERDLRPDTTKVQMTLEDLEQAQQQVADLPFSNEAQLALLEIDFKLRDGKIVPSDRRAALSVRVCQAAAYLDGSDTVEPRHLVALRYTVWSYVEHEKESGAIITKIAAPTMFEIDNQIESVQDVLGAIEVDLRKPRTNELARLQMDRINKLNSSFSLIRSLTKTLELDLEYKKILQGLSDRRDRLVFQVTTLAIDTTNTNPKLFT